MLRTLRSELVVLRRRGFLGGAVGGPVAAAMLGVVIAFLRADRGPGSLTIARLSQPDGLAAVLQRSAELLGVVVLGIAAVAVAQGFSTGAVRTQLVRESRRVRLLAGKAGAVLVLSAAVVALAMAAATVTALVLGPMRGIQTGAWFGTGLGDTLSTSGDLLLATLGYAVLGMLLALAFRSTAPAVIVGIAWALPIEGLLGATWEAVAHWTPVQQLDAIVVHGNAISSYGFALALSAVFATAAAVGGATLFARRDVTA